MITGSAPVSGQVLTFVRCAPRCFVIEGCGQTECVAACTVRVFRDIVPGHLGVPSPCNSTKLVNVPELNYFAKDQAGKACVRGFNVFRGYYKNEEETNLVLDADGWLHTGDIEEWTERGTLKIVDRKKHIFKLAQGEYIAPEKIEHVYLRSKYVAQCFVYGGSLKVVLSESLFLMQRFSAHLLWLNVIRMLES
uniref:long-chain-fatty-acid--CoA ligase n=1 Tax=Ditylenchus dipsaci TaxID=166011 RepID=A0A915DAY1_9BILA